MDFMLDIQIKSPEQRITYNDNIFVIGSCFTEHIGGRLEQFKFSILQNPNGILFDPVSVCKSITSYVHDKQYVKENLFQLNELWQSWHHHSNFSGMNADEVLQSINQSQHQAFSFLKKADWLIITLGSSFSYRLVDSDESVANCHRAPAKWFRKHLTGIGEMSQAFSNCLSELFQFNSKLKVIFTVSPVRHIRDGVVENNRSKARLIETVHQLITDSDRLYYFPAYELVIDVLRDYRFYDTDLVHPNYSATEFVFEQFVKSFINKGDVTVMEEIKEIVRAFRHKPFQPETQAHRKFMESYLLKIRQFKEKHPKIDLSKEEVYFSSNHS